MRIKKRLLSLLLCGAVLFSLYPQRAAAQGVWDSGAAPAESGLCGHHPQHDESCGYTGGSGGTPCAHEHTEGCYTLVTDCVHEHTDECYPAESVPDNTATPSNAGRAGPTDCAHVCSGDSGCITEVLDCGHAHDEDCGYAPADGGTPCGYVCEICDTKDSGGAAATVTATPSNASDSAVADVQALIDALPTADEFKSMDAEAQLAAYNQVQAAYDAYTALTDEQKELITGVEIFDELFAVFNGMVSTLAATANVKYIDEDGEEKIASEATVVETGTTTWETGWYVVNNDVEISNRITVSGEVHLILADGWKLTASSGIQVSEGNSLTIYGQAGGTGTLIATGSGGAGIGGSNNENGGAITINGGTITATGGYGSAGIGGGSNGSGGAITINGGIITASAQASLGDPAGIGGGGYGSAGTIIITGGIVNATGSQKGIGSGSYRTEGSIAISGGVVTANGIGTGGYNSSTTTTITGDSTVICTDVQYGGINNSDQSSWSGLIIEGDSGKLYGSQTLAEDIPWPEDNLTLEIPSGTTLTIPAGVTIPDNVTLIGEGNISPSKLAAKITITKDLDKDYDGDSVSLGDGDYTYTGNGQPEITWHKDNNEAIGERLGEAPSAPGTYWVKVSAEATNFYTAAEDQKQFTISVTPLDVPTDLSWDSESPGQATWSTVTNASGYSVQLYKDGEVKDDPVTINNADTTSYDFTSTITEPGSYTFTVTATGSGNYSNSEESSASDALHTVSFETNGGSSIDMQLVINEDNATEPSGEPTREGYTFGGWYNDEDCTTEWNFERDTVTVATTLYAKWTASTYQVTLDTNGGAINSDNVTGYTYGQGATLPTDVTRDGYAFAGWYENDDFTGEAVTEISASDTGEKTYYAKWTKLYTVTVTAGTGGTVSGGGTFADGESVTVTATADSGYRFVRWTENGVQVSTSANYSFTLSADRTLTAVFSRNSTGGGGGGGTTTTNPPTVKDTDGGSVAVSPSSPRPGQTVTVTPDPDEGYQVEEIIVTDSSGNVVEVTDNGDGTWSFTQPSGSVTIEVTFAKENPSTGVDNPFTDVSESDWFYDDVMFVYQNGLMTGTNDTTFSPNSNTTRAQVAVILYRMEGSPDVTGDSPFTDVENGPGTAWYYNAVLWAQQNGIVAGYGDGLFNPGGDITREQLAVILYNYARYKGYDVTAAGDLSGFADAGDVSSWALPAIRWAVGSGIMSGYGDGVLGPQGTATRAQVAAMLRRFIEV